MGPGLIGGLEIHVLLYVGQVGESTNKTMKRINIYIVYFISC